MEYSAYPVITRERMKEFYIDEERQDLPGMDDLLFMQLKNFEVSLGEYVRRYRGMHAHDLEVKDSGDSYGNL